MPRKARQADLSLDEELDSDQSFDGYYAIESSNSDPEKCKGTGEFKKMRPCRHLKKLHLPSVKKHATEMWVTNRSKVCSSTSCDCKEGNVYICCHCSAFSCKYHMVKHSQYHLFCDSCRACGRTIDPSIDKVTKAVDQALLVLKEAFLASKGQDHLAVDTFNRLSLVDSPHADTSGAFLPALSPFSRLKIPVVGLCNLGNTCFFNSTLQALLHTAPIFELLTSKEFPSMLSEENANFQLWKSMYSFFLQCYRSKSMTSCDPDPLFERISRKWPVYRKMRQQDSHEFLRLFLEALDDESDPPPNRSLPLKQPLNQISNDEKQALLEKKKRPRLMEQIFGGKLLSCIKCLHCRHVFKVEEPFMDLSLAITWPMRDQSSPERRDGFLTNLKKNWLPNFLNTTPIPLEALLENFVQVDSLNDQECFDCEKCSKERNPSDLQPIELPLPPEDFIDDAVDKVLSEETHPCSAPHVVITPSTDSFQPSDTDSNSLVTEDSGLESDSSTSGAELARNSNVIYRRAEKWERIAEYPKVLVIHLNRFSYTGFRGRFSKNSLYVGYPEYLSLDKYSVSANPTEFCLMSPEIKETSYQLYATIVHWGGSADSGHYIAMVRGGPDGKDWFKCSDTNVIPVALRDVLLGDAYILFYQKLA